MYWSSAPRSQLTILCIAEFLTLASGNIDGFDCQAYWSGPSTHNSISECLGSADWVTHDISQLILPALCVLFLVLSIIVYPIVFLCCQCCQPNCCCQCCRDLPPEKRAESKGSRSNVAILIVIALGLCVAILVIFITGSAQLLSGADAIFVNLDANVVDFFLQLADDLQAAVYDNTTGNLTEPFTNSTFDSLRDQIGGVQNTTEGFHGQLTTYSKLVTSVGYGVAVVPLFLLGFTGLFAICNCRRCCPSCFTCIYFLFGILFSILGLVLLILGMIVFTPLCDEINLQTSRSPGLFQWYVVPKCEDFINFTEQKETIDSMEASFAGKFCQEIALNLCDPNITYDAGQPTKVFWCNITNATARAACPTFQAASAVVAASYAKTSSPVCGGSNCTITQCPTLCTDGTAQNATKTALKLLRSANLLFNALDLVLPLMDCNVIIDRVLLILKSCPDLRDGLTKLGVAFFITLVAIVFGWLIMMRGQKLWFSQSEYEEGELAEAELKNMDGVSMSAKEAA